MGDIWAACWLLVGEWVLFSASLVAVALTCWPGKPDESGENHWKKNEREEKEKRERICFNLWLP